MASTDGQGERREEPTEEGGDRKSTPCALDRGSHEPEPPGGPAEVGLSTGEEEAERPLPVSRLRPWFHYGAYIAIAFFAVLVDPFNWSEATSTVSQDLVYRLFIGPLYSTDQRDLTTVVLFNEKTLRDLREKYPVEEIHWPVSLKWHARALRNILRNHPEAVMVDFIFPDMRPDEEGVEALKKVAKEYKGTSTSLYFARAEGANVSGIRADLVRDLTLVSITRPSEPGITHGTSRSYEPCSKILIEDENDPRFGRWVCACTTKDFGLEACDLELKEHSPTQSVAYTAAFQLFHNHNKQPPDGFDRNDPIDLQVVWSNRLNRWNDSRMARIVNNRTRRLCKDVDLDAWSWLSAAFDTDRFRQGCPYTNTIFASSVLFDPYHEDNQKYLEGKYVFYGGDLAGLADTVVPPTHEKLPGVYLHAMAFDNLVSFDGNYKRSLGDAIGDSWELSLNLLIAAVSATIIVFFARSGSKHRTRRGEIETAETAHRARVVRQIDRPWRWLFLGAPVVIVQLCLIFYLTSPLAPLDWLGFSGLFLFVSALAREHFVEGTAGFISDRALPWIKKGIYVEEGT